MTVNEFRLCEIVCEIQNPQMWAPSTPIINLKANAKKQCAFFFLCFWTKIGVAAHIPCAGLASNILLSRNPGTETVRNSSFYLHAAHSMIVGSFFFCFFSVFKSRNVVEPIFQKKPAKQASSGAKYIKGQGRSFEGIKKAI